MAMLRSPGRIAAAILLTLLLAPAGAQEMIDTPSRKVPVLYDVDVVVIGGGLSGFGAAMGAARTGAKTLLVERTGYLGGWIRGLEIVSALVADDYTPERAKALVQPEALTYFGDRVETLNPRLRTNPAIQIREKNLKAIRAIVVKENENPPSADEVKELRRLAGEIVDQI